MRSPFRDRAVTVPALLCVLLAALTTVTACSEDRSWAPGPTVSETHLTSPPAPEAPAVSTRARLGRVIGRLPRPRRALVRRQVTRVVDRWWQAAYLGGDYPRSGISSSFPGFTDGAEQRARRDRLLMTNADIGDRVDSVTATRRRLVLDLLAVGTRVRSVTARFELRFRTTGERAGRVTVRGRLFLTRRPSGWRVFGYDVTKGAR